MKTYLATYADRDKNIVSEAEFRSMTLQHAKWLAQNHKRHTPEIKKVTGVTTTVKLLKR